LAVIVRRLPAAKGQHRRLWDPLQNNSIIATADNISRKTISERLDDEFGPALFNTNNNEQTSSNKVQSAEVDAVQTETMNIIDMMNRRMNNGTTTSMAPSNGRGRARKINTFNNNKDGKQSYRSQRGEPPMDYVCHRCHISGHWIQDCPTNGNPEFDKKHRNKTQRNQIPVPKPAIPTNIAGDVGATDIGTTKVIVGTKCYQIPTNVYQSFNGDHSKIKAYIQISSGTTTNNFQQTKLSQAHGIDSRYKCEICTNYYVDARFTPCCRVTYCNECIRHKSLVQNPSMIQCPACEEIFSAEALDTSQNTKLQEKVNKIVAKQTKQKKEENVITLNINQSNTPSPNKFDEKPSSVQTPSPSISVINPPSIRPTVILKQSPSSIQTTQIITPPTLKQNTATLISSQSETPKKPQIAPIDPSQYKAPKNTIPTTSNMDYVCIECNQRGHKYKDCPNVLQKKANSEHSQNNIGITINPQRIAPHVQIINNSRLNPLNLNVINMNNQITSNNILMNGAFRRTGNIAPKFINSHNNTLPLSRPSNGSLLAQQTALNRMRTTNRNNLNCIKQQNGTIPPELLESTINELKSVMASSDPSNVTNAINAAFIKLGAIDPDSKRQVLQQLVTACSNQQKNGKNNHNVIESEHSENIKKTKKKHKRKRNKEEKERKRRHRSRRKKDKDRRSKSSKDRKRRRRRKREKERNRSRSRSRDKRSRSDSSENESEPIECNKSINIENPVISNPDQQENAFKDNPKKRKLPTAIVPDFVIVPSPKKRKIK